MEMIKNLNIFVDRKKIPEEKENEGKLKIQIDFPLPDGTVCVKGVDPEMFNIFPKYSKQRLISGHNADFMYDPLFLEAVEYAEKACGGGGDYKSWNTYVCLWAANRAKTLPGDFVECGVNKGGYSRAIVHFIDFNKTGKTFYLADTFTGIPEKLVTAEEKEYFQRTNCDIVKYHNTVTYKKDVFEEIKETFKAFNVKIVRGEIPDTLPQIDAKQVAYLSIDMNIVIPEIAAAEYLWDNIVSGGIIVLDDYGWDMHLPQKKAFDEFAKKRSVLVLPLPTGQGIILKP